MTIVELVYDATTDVYFRGIEVLLGGAPLSRDDKDDIVVNSVKVGAWNLLVEPRPLLLLPSAPRPFGILDAFGRMSVILSWPKHAPSFDVQDLSVRIVS